MLTNESLRARVRRLEQLTLGLAKEIAVVGDAEDPLLYLERKAYLPWPAPTRGARDPSEEEVRPMAKQTESVARYRAAIEALKTELDAACPVLEALLYHLTLLTVDGPDGKEQPAPFPPEADVAQAQRRVGAARDRVFAAMDELPEDEWRRITGGGPQRRERQRRRRRA